MGGVYPAHDSCLGRDFALKILPAEFAREWRAASALSRPNIVTVHDVGDRDGVSYLVTGLVEGESLCDLIERGPVSLRKTIDIGANRILEGVDRN